MLIMNKHHHHHHHQDSDDEKIYFAIQFLVQTHDVFFFQIMSLEPTRTAVNGLP